jgi:hypothetical protein
MWKISGENIIFESNWVVAEIYPVDDVWIAYVTGEPSYQERKFKSEKAAKVYVVKAGTKYINKKIESLEKAKKALAR